VDGGFFTLRWRTWGYGALEVLFGIREGCENLCGYLVLADIDSDIRDTAAFLYGSTMLYFRLFAKQLDKLDSCSC